ncbi:MAG: M6 family metalloprotease domain-containing protein [Gemmatimonadaceae bacterium]
MLDPVAAVVITPASATLEVGATLQLTAVPSDRTGRPLTGQVVVWSTSDASKASVSALGLVTAITPTLGEPVLVTAAVGKASATSAITVAPVSVATVDVAPPTLSMLPGDSRQLVATAKDARGNPLDGRAVTWRSIAPSIASVSVGGHVVGISPGVADITATIEGVVGAARVTILPVPVARIELAPMSGSLSVGDTVRVTATVRDARGNSLSGRAVSWSSTSPAIASVSSSGLITAIAPGVTMVTATSEGVSASAMVRVVEGALVKMLGDTQEGFQGRALADSLLVRVLDRHGAPATGVPVTWASTAGAINPQVAISDGGGLAAAQWVMPPTDASGGSLGVTATAAGGATATFSATVRPLSSCQLARGPNTYLTEGPTDYDLNTRATGIVRAVMIFIDFADAQQNESTHSVYNLIVPEALDWLREASFGRLTLNVTAVHKWYRMPRSAQSYGMADGVTFPEHVAYIADAVRLADADVDFSQYDVFYITATHTPLVPTSPAFVTFRGFGVLADGKELRNGATFGADARITSPYGAHVFVHETGHIFGLPDLYSFLGEPYPDVLRFIGGWDTMSSLIPGAHFLAWHKLKLGWIDPSQADCLSGRGGLEAIIEPLETSGGLKLIAVLLDSSRAVVAEVRRPLGRDARLCDFGVLLYEVDARTPNGYGPVVIRGAAFGTEPALLQRCGPYYAGTLDRRTGKAARFADPVSGHAIDVIRAEGASYRVRIRKN